MESNRRVDPGSSGWRLLLMVLLTFAFTLGMLVLPVLVLIFGWGLWPVNWWWVAAGLVAAAGGVIVQVAGSRSKAS